MELNLFELLSDEANSRLIGNVTAFVQTIGLVLPALFAAFTYASRSRQRARDEIIEFFSEWNSLDKRQAREEGAVLLRVETDPSQILEDDERRQSLTAFLNDYEFLAMFILSEGRGSKRQEVARDYFKADVISKWRLARPVVEHLRARYGSSRLFSEFERLANSWSGQ